jgi:hypothetical protein
MSLWFVANAVLRSLPLFPFPEGSDLFSLLQVSIINYLKNTHLLQIEHKIPPFDERRPFWEYQLFIKNFNDYVEQYNKKILEEEGVKDIFSAKKENYGI